MSNYRENEVFISYNRKDKLMVKPIAESLEEQGINIWIDWRKEALGKIWVEKLENAIKKASDVVVLFGKHGLGDVQTDEYHAAYGLKKNLIPVLLPGANEEKLATFLKNRDWLDLRDGFDEENIVKLVQGLISDKSEQLDSDKSRNSPKRVYQKFSTPLEFCYTQNSRFGEQLQISRHAKESIARYCARVDSDFKWGKSVFIQAGSLSAFILFHMYRTNSQNQPKIIITNLLACSAISMTAKAQADSLGETTCGIDNVQTHLIEGNLIGNFASTMPEDLMGQEGKFCDDENRKCSSLVDCLELKQPDHVVMMATYFKANKGPYSNDLHSCRLKKLLMRYVHKNSQRKTRLSVVFEADKLNLRKPNRRDRKVADDIDIPEGAGKHYWTKLLQSGRIGVFSALSLEMDADEEYRKEIKAELRAVKEMGASPVILLGTGGDPIPLS